MDQTRLAFCPPRGYVLKKRVDDYECVCACVRVCVCERASKRIEGVGMYVSAIMIKVFPLRELAGVWWMAAWGCTPSARESEASALRGLKTGQRTCCAEMRIFISCDSVMKTFNRAFVCIHVRTMRSVWAIPSDKICPCTQALIFSFLFFWILFIFASPSRSVRDLNGLQYSDSSSLGIQSQSMKRSN